MSTDPAPSPGPAGQSPETPVFRSRPSAVWPALATSLLVIAAAGGLALATKDRWLPLVRGPESPDPSFKIATLEARIAKLEDQVRAAAVPAPVSASASPSAPAPAIDKAQLDDLGRRLAESESRATDLARRLAAVEGARTQHARADAATQALILAVGQVRAQASTGLPFPKELDSLKTLAAERAGIVGPVEKIAAIAPSGAPTAAELRRQFETVARAVAIAARAGDDAHWTERLKSRLFALVAIRRTDGGAAEGTPDALTLAAETALAAGDIAQAVAAVEKLSGPPAASAREWLARARARVQLDAALADLHAHAVAALAGGG